MSCGLIRIQSKIKKLYAQFYLWLFRNRYGYFHCHHCCVGCRFYGTCIYDYNQIAISALQDKTIVEGPIDLYEEEK